MRFMDKEKEESIGIEHLEAKEDAWMRELKN